MKIPLFKAYIDKVGVSEINRVLASARLSRGKEIESFEKEFSVYVNKNYAVATNSGTSALHIAVRSLGWKAGDEIITTPFSYIASSNVLLFEGVKPVFVDIDPYTLNIDPKKIAEKITARTRGLMIVDIFGLPCDYKEISKIKNKYNLKIIEDACEAFGRPTNNFPVGKLGDITVFGFHENKQITTLGEGGMIVTNDKILAQKCWSMRDQGRSLKKKWIKNVILGFNFRMTEIQAAFGRTQLRIADKIFKRREQIAKKYELFLKECNGITLPKNISSKRRSWFLYFIICKSFELREKIYNSLLNAQIGCSKNYFPPIYNFPMYSKYSGKGFTHTEKISKTLLALPMFYGMKDVEIGQVVEVIKNAINGN